MNHRRLFIAGALAACLAGPALAQNAPWPSKPIHFIVPFPVAGDYAAWGRAIKAAGLKPE